MDHGGVPGKVVCRKPGCYIAFPSHFSIHLGVDLSSFFFNMFLSCFSFSFVSLAY